MKNIINIIRAVFAVGVFTAIIAQFTYNYLYVDTFNAANFFSFFTILSNGFAAVVLLISAYIGWKGKPSRKLEYFRGAATLYMVIVGVIYYLLLRGFEADLNAILPWVNLILHYIFPVYMLVDWLISPLAHKLRFKYALIWLIFPLAYLFYSLIRGSIVNWYPYPFLNPNTGDGVTKVVVIALCIAAFSFGLTWLLTRKKAVNP